MVFPLDSSWIQMFFMISSFHSFRESQHGSHRFNTFISRSNIGVSSLYSDGDDQAVSFRLLIAALHCHSICDGIRNRHLILVLMLRFLLLIHHLLIGSDNDHYSIICMVSPINLICDSLSTFSGRHSLKRMQTVPS